MRNHCGLSQARGDVDNDELDFWIIKIRFFTQISWTHNATQVMLFNLLIVFVHQHVYLLLKFASDSWLFIKN